MFEILGEEYYIDFDRIDEILVSDKSYEAGDDITTETINNYDHDGKIIGYNEVITKSHKNREINAVRYETIRSLIDDLGDASVDVLDSIGRTDSDKLTIKFKLAFNTLFAYEILKTLK